MDDGREVCPHKVSTELFPEFLERARKLNESLCELGLEADVMRECRDRLYQSMKESDMECFMYQLTVLELMLNSCILRLQALQRGNLGREIYVVESEGKAYLVDLGCNKKIEIPKMTPEEEKRYINHRAGRIIYTFEKE